MRRGTTPTDTFNVDVDLTSAEEIFITYRQGSYNCFEKSIDNITVTADKLECTHTQEETLRLNPKMPLKAQIRARFPNGSSVASDIIELSVEAILKEGVI